MALCYFNGAIMNIGNIANFSECKKFECKDSEITAKLIKLPPQDKVNLNNCKLTGKIEYGSEQHLENKYSNDNYFEADWIEGPKTADKMPKHVKDWFEGNLDFDDFIDALQHEDL